MAMRLVVSICCIVTSSAAAVYSEVQFKKEYDGYVIGKDASAVKTANANIVGAVPPQQQIEKDLHRWYHDVNAAVQADAKAIMGKTLADRLAMESYPLAAADCMAKINSAIGAKDDKWANLYPIYLSVSGDKVEADNVEAQKKIAAKGKAAGSAEDLAFIAATNQAAACHCVHALSGAEKDLAIKNGFNSKLFAFFKKEMTDALKNENSVAGVSAFVTGTLAADAPVAVPKGQKTQPMYSKADATLRGEMMIAMVNQLKAKLPAVLE